MAKTAIARRSAPIIVMSPPKRRSVARRRVTRIARRAGRRVATHARAASIPSSMLLGSAALGYAQAKGHLNRIPTIGGSRALTLGVAGYAATRISRNPTVRNLGFIAMVVGAFDWGAKQGGGKSALEGDDDIDGDDDYEY